VATPAGQGRKPGAARLLGQRGKTATANLAALCYQDAFVDS
jgi:hypothetical protein